METSCAEGAIRNTVHQGNMETSWRAGAAPDTAHQGNMETSEGKVPPRHPAPGKHRNFGARSRVGWNSKLIACAGPLATDCGPSVTHAAANSFLLTFFGQCC